MVKAVLTTKVEPVYDDLPEQRYHFPRSYLRQIEAAIGDWVVYYEPRRSSGDLNSRGGRQSYFATARIQRIEPDPARPDHFYAIITDYLDFQHPVPFRMTGAGMEQGRTFEGGLSKPDGSTNKGAFGRAVRKLPDADYDRIIQAGFGAVIGRPSHGIIADLSIPTDPPPPGFAEPPTLYTGAPVDSDPPPPTDRPLIERLTLRPFRDRAFSRAVKAAYDQRCAMTGIHLIDGQGQTEAQAAHIRPVAHDGPDSVRNGIALTATLHWMFDHGLIAIDGDHRLLTAAGRIPDTITRLLPADGRLTLPGPRDLHPHPAFLAYHRRVIFRG